MTPQTFQRSQSRDLTPKKHYLVAITLSLTLVSPVVSGWLTPAQAEQRLPIGSFAQVTNTAQPNMERALLALDIAQQSLSMAVNDKGGHRTKALNLVQQAQKETQLGVEYARKSGGRTSSIAATDALKVLQNSASQPNMERALAALKIAQQSLNNAVDDKGGHRTKAVTLVQQAIQETQAGIEYAQNSTYQLSLQQALASLKVAQNSLNAANDENGGHRYKAAQFVQQALQETQLGLLGANTTSSVALPNSLQSQVKQPPLEQALAALKDAQQSLNATTYDKDGHRTKALALVQQATKETQLGINYKQNLAYQTNMQQALTSLKAAMQSINAAKPDKGGHQAKALQLLQQLMRETQLGIEYSQNND